MTIYDQIAALQAVNEGRTSGHDSSHDVISLGLQDYVLQLNRLQTAIAQRTLSWQATTLYPAGSIVVSPRGDVLLNTVAFTSRSSFDTTEAARWSLSTSHLQSFRTGVAYAAGAQIVSTNGDVVSAKVAFTSGANFNSSDWNYSTSYALTGDSRLSDTRTPTAHAASHAAGTSDSLSSLYLSTTDPRMNRIPTAQSGVSSPSRYVGGTTTSYPTSGSYLAGDYVTSGDGKMWICTVSGSPGTWVAAGLPDTVTGSVLGAPYVSGTGRLWHDIGTVSPTILSNTSGLVSFPFTRTYTGGIISVNVYVVDYSTYCASVTPVLSRMSSRAIYSGNGLDNFGYPTSAKTTVILNYDVWGWTT